MRRAVTSRAGASTAASTCNCATEPVAVNIHDNVPSSSGRPLLDTDFRRHLFAMQGALVLVCALSAITAIAALTVTDRARRTAQQAGADVAMLDAVRMRLDRLAAAGERNLIGGDGLARLTIARGELGHERERLHGLAHDPELAGEVAAVERDLEDFAEAIEHAASLRSEDGRESFLAYRAVLKPIRQALDEDARVLARTLASRRDDSSEKSATIASQARWALAVTGLVGILMTVALSVVTMRELRGLARRARAAAGQAKRTPGSRDELVAASKELRAPLQLITSCATRLDTTRDREAVENILDAATRMREVLDSWLEVSAVEVGAHDLSCERCDTSALLDTAIKSLQLLATERLVNIRVDAAMPVLVYVDRRRLLQVLATIVGAAVRSARPGGEITITVRPSTTGARFAITDPSAPAVPPALEALLERPASQPDETTIGLQVARRLIDAHGGRIGSEGATVWFTLPSEPRLLQEPATSARA